MTYSFIEFFEAQWLFPIFVAGWFGICAALSYLAGWPGLAARFRSPHSVAGKCFRFASGAIVSSKGIPVSYRGCMFLTVSETGFHLALFFPFRFLCPPLFIPWAAVETVSEKHFWFIRHKTIQLHDLATQIMVTGRAGQYIAETHARFKKQHAL